MKLLKILLPLLLLSAPLFAEDFQAMLQEVDEIASYLDSDFSAVYTIVEKSPNAGTEKTVSAVFRRDIESTYVIIVLEPTINKGQGYLKVDDSLWFYDPESRRYNFSSSADRFQNTNARNSDFTSSTLAEDYKVVSGEQTTLGKYNTWKLSLESVTDEVAYPKMTIWVDEDRLVRKTEDYSFSGQLLRTTAFPSYQKVDGRFVPHQFLLVDTLSKARTQISLTKVSLDDLPSSTFSKQFLEKMSQ